MSFIERFYPEQKIVDSLSYKDQKKLKILVLGNIVTMAAFLLFAVILLVSGKTLVFGLMAVISLCYLASLIYVKRGRLVVGSYITTINLAAACFVVAFFTSHIGAPAVCYRTTCFCLCIATLNSIISIKKGQNLLFMGISTVLLISSTFILHYPTEFMQNPKEWIFTMSINELAILVCGILFAYSLRSNNAIVEHSETEHKQIAENLNMITNVLGEVRESMNVGQKLNSAADSASSSVTSISQVYKALLQETDHLNKQVKNIQDSSRVVGESSGIMAEGINQQNNSLSEVSSAITEISANISNIDDIAEKRRSGMTDVTNLLHTQSILINKIVEDVRKVQESSKRIEEFVQTVDTIAQQTNLLAMNASIEAAHAGETGKGFSVIAQEIRKLSEETTANANKISDTLQTNTIVVKETSDSVDEFAGVTKKSTDEIMQTLESMEEIIRGISEIDAGTKDIMLSINKVVDVANDNSGVIDKVVDQISGQNEGITNITNDSLSLKQRVESISSMLSNISSAIDEVHQSAMENESVSNRIADLLK